MSLGQRYYKKSDLKDIFIYKSNNCVNFLLQNYAWLFGAYPVYSDNYHLSRVNISNGVSAQNDFSA